MYQRCSKHLYFRACYGALQQIESNPMYWVGLGCIFERSSEENELSDRKAYDAYEAALEVATIPWFEFPKFHL